MSPRNSSAETAAELNELLARPASELVRWENQHFDELTGSWSRSLVLFGAGGLGRKTLRGLRQVGVEPLAFADNNASLHSTVVDGLRVLSPAEAAQEFGNRAVFIVTIFMASAPGLFETTRRQLMALGCRQVISFVPLFWKYPKELLPHYVYDLPHRVIEAASSIHAAWELIKDEASRVEYLAQLRWRLNPDFDQIPGPATHDLYFPPDLFSLTDQEVFVDCGSYSGDTIQSFLRHCGGRFLKLFAFEPDPMNFQQMVRSIAALPAETARRMVLKELAVGDRAEVLHFNAQAAASSSVSHHGQFTVRSEALDSVLESEAPTIVKMDIEGAELDALSGAARTIREHLPILAISAYHLQDHLWNVPLAVHALSDSYRFHFRRHSPYVLDDLVLYAIPAHRRPS